LFTSVLFVFLFFDAFEFCVRSSNLSRKRVSFCAAHTAARENQKKNVISKKLGEVVTAMFQAYDHHQCKRIEKKQENYQWRNQGKQRFCLSANGESTRGVTHQRNCETKMSCPEKKKSLKKSQKIL
jgi:hypothetical protein